MDLDFSNDDLLGKENDLTDAAYDFLGVQKGNSMNVRNACLLLPLLLADCLGTSPSCHLLTPLFTASIYFSFCC